MPHTAKLFSQQLTFNPYSDFTVDCNDSLVGHGDGIIDVYLFDSNSIASEQITALAERYLAPQEYAIFSKRKQQQAQQEYLASRLLIKNYASKRLGYDFAELYVLFDNQDNCLHIYHNNAVIPLRCCISHSHGQVLIALVPIKATAPAIKLGIDLELISAKRSLEKVAKHYYHEQEQLACLAQTEGILTDPANNRHKQALYRIWTLKEALAKAIKQPIAKLLRDNVFAHCEPLNVHSGCYYVKHQQTFDISIISDLKLTDNTANNSCTNVKVLTGLLDQDFLKVK